MHRISTGKKWITASVAGALTVAIIGTALYRDASVALARPSLPGIEDIVNGNSSTQPFKILEIVDQYPSARIGFTVEGEEPGNDQAQALSDMASYGERYNHYMVPGVAEKNSLSFPAYSELKDKAFAYDTTVAFDWGDNPETDPTTAYTAETEGIKVGKAYGKFVDNTDDPHTGRYSAADTSGDYKLVNDGTAATDGNKTIDEVYQKLPGTDQTGIFYMNYGGFVRATTTLDPSDPDYSVLSNRRYNITKYEMIDDTNSWKYPFEICDRDYLPDVTTSYKWYDENRYVVNEPFEAVQNNGADETDPADDTYEFSTSPAVGDVIYVTDDEKLVLTYYGFISEDPLDNTKLVLNYCADSDGDYDDTLPLTDLTTNNSFAKVVFDIPADKYLTVRKATTEDGPAIKKYYISETVKNVNGIYDLLVSYLRGVNDPNFLPEQFGIVDETDKVGAGNPWYHEWYYKSKSSTPYVYEPTLKGEYDFVHDFAEPEVDTFYYKGGFTNNEWFKTQVLDVDRADCSKICIDVITKKMKDVTPEDIGSANLIYFTGGGAYDGDSSGMYDMRYETAAALVTAVDSDNKPVIINLTAVNAGTQFKIPKNFKNAVLLMLQNDIDGIGQYAGTSDWSISTEKSDELIQLALAYYTNAAVAGNDVSHVAGPVFINDNLGTRTDAIAADFTTTYTDAKVNGFTLNGKTFDGFKEVQKDIDEELFYLDVAGKDVSAFNDKISKATSIRYILNYGDRRVVGKKAIRVLDLEPYYARDIEGVVEDYVDVDALKKIYYNPTDNAKQDGWTVNNIAQIRDIFAINWFKKNVSDTTDSIKVTGMGTKEFIGRIEDLNESYDLIYIGMDTAYLNTKLTNTDTNNKTGDKTKEVLSNNTGKYNEHYVYRHTGDAIGTSGQTGGDGTWLLGGNDITPDKLRELKNYVQAGYAVILSDEFFTYNTNGSLKDIDTTRIQEESYLYDFVNWCITEKDDNNNLRYLYKNVEITRNFENNVATTDGKTMLSHKESFVRYLNISKLTVEVKEQPPLYNPYNTNDSNVHNYLVMNNYGQYTLDYKIKLTNDAAVDTTKTDYNCQLYIDHDGDGRYEAVEMLDSLEIRNEDSGDWLDPDSSGKFHLTTGATYSISRRVPEGYVGLIPWKLVFIENRDGNDALIKTAVQDYSAISDYTNKPTIKILQITSGDGEASNLRLWDDARLMQLYNQVIDFNISVDHVTSKEFIDGTGTIFGSGVNKLDKLYEYDMLVLGFLDMYSLTGSNVANTKEAVLYIREYMLSGRSVLFTHDLTSTSIKNNDSLDWGSLADNYLRDIQGMDRYGYTQQYVNDLKFSDGKALTEYKSVYDTRWNTPRDVNKVGFSDSALLRHNSWQWGEISAQYTRNISNADSGQNERELTSVSRVNRGQITEYPFRIGSLEQSNIANGDTNYYANEYITVATTHHQYFQLNMETNYLDDNYDDDIVVWYTISLPGTEKANYHKLNYNDVRNNYYIYSKGNILYTGAGHSNITGDEEKKLFVNTLVAAYNAGTHAPYAAYKNGDTRMATDISSTFIPYDIAFSQPVEDGGEADGWLQDTVTVYFKTVNNNLQDNAKPLIAQYYVEVPSGGDITIGTTQYKKITPVANSVKMCTVSNATNTVTYTDVDDPQLLVNGRVYKMEFAISDLMNGNLQGVNTRYHAKIYTRMRTQTKGKTVDEDKTDIGATGTFTSLPASDSMKPLNVNFTQLYDLR